MFAGPNGSGKSTLKTILPDNLLGVYLNPDEIEAQIRRDGTFDARDVGVQARSDIDEKILNFFAQSNLLKSQGLLNEVERLTSAQGKIDFSQVGVNSYWASVVADCLRQELLSQRFSFTIETVMSSKDKIRLLEQAQKLEYRTYLYFIATDDPAINVSRVQNRVRSGGHAVPIQKILDRYDRSLGLLHEAIRHTDRAYIFDNSKDGQQHTWLAEISEGKNLQLKTSEVPDWFTKAVLRHISPI